MIELNELKDAAQKAFPADQLSPDRDESWKLIAEMGWLMLPVPEELGGLGLGRDAATALHFELGRVLSSAPLITAMFSVQVLCAADKLANKAEWVERACSGEFITLNMLSNDVTLNDDGTLSGPLYAVPDADMASHVIVFVPGLSVLVPLDTDGVTVTERPLWDESRRLFEVTLEKCPVDRDLVIAEGDRSQEIGLGFKAESLLALAADSLGGATATLEMTVEYLKTRKQFNRPLAMFQSLKHRCADLKTQITAAEALLWSRAADMDASLADMGALKALAADVYQFVTEEAIQLHGGIGLTDEHQCHLFMKRAMLNLSLGGSGDELKERTGRQALAAFAAK
ncbi:MAG: acyl-CoA/acyl-ACP dehydrogenase [Novosphingobium sp.]|nr:acyl-CoA/acyl-ACP dehydrogenase [Novosphingobium sp.]MCP5402465.1 acyl-CoA/acyl-ACP dehydrogenase [Novosphingobium sp.]